MADPAAVPAGLPPGPGVQPPGPPGPPPGPGVQPPFVAAPIEGRRARLWLGLGLAGAVLVACCGVGVVAVGGLLVLGEQVATEAAQRAVTDYLTALTERDWEEAYELRCPDDRTAESLAEFTGRVSAQPEIESYQVHDADLGQDPTTDVTVPVAVTYASGQRAQLIFPVAQGSGGRYEVCGTIQQA